jgi:signal transduction histidine kinase/ActR/RegA family two-component response regulator
VKIRTRAFLLGLLPTLLVAIVLTAFHVVSRLDELDARVTQQGMALARHLAASAEYGVLSGNRQALEKLLDQAMDEPGVKSALVLWSDRTRLVRGEPIGRLPPMDAAGQWQYGRRSWFTAPVRLTPLGESDPFIDESGTLDAPLAWVAVSVDLQQKQRLAQQLLLASLGITLTGLLLAILLIRKLALTGLKPLIDIIATVKHISSGGFGARMDVTAASPELRELQAMVNQMSESLRSYREDMEARVHAVTAELEHKKQEAEQANLAKSRFLAAASHDLRQPMHAIGLYVESLKTQMQGRGAADTLNKIQRSIENMVELFNAILDVTKLDAGVVQPQPAPVRIRRLLLYLADEFAPEADKKGLALRVRARDAWIESDPILLERIIRNLLSNALQHTARGGVLLSARPHRGGIRLQVWDTGSGIPAEHQSRIFDEFYQVGTEAAQTRHGLGLGLAIVRRLARLLGHPLQMHSRPGRGTAFSLDVPLLASPPAVAEQPAGMGSGALKGRVAIVDDDPTVRDALGRLLVQWGLEPQLFGGLQEVRRALQSAPDVVLADYQLLDGETGLAVIEAIRERWGRSIPAILVTGDTRAETVQMLDALGHLVLYKPLQPAQLLAQLRSVLGAKHANAERLIRPE